MHRYIPLFCTALLRNGACWAILLAALASVSFAQDKEPISYNAFVDTTIAHDFNHLPTRYRAYTTQPYYTDEGALNLGFIDATLDTSRYYGRVAWQYGSSVVANYAAEPHTFVRYLQEAYSGIQISAAWSIDVGIFLSHLGLESWISRDNFTVSRSLVADYSPYYQSGVRTSYTFSNEVQATALLLRGWQNISDDKDPALGTQITYDVSSKTSLKHNSFVGETNGMRVFNNLVAKYEGSANFGIAGSYDVGVQSRHDDTHAIWHGWTLIPHYKVNDSLATALRVEQYHDPHQVIIKSIPDKGFNTTGLSINVDITLAPRLVWRNEYKVLVSSQNLFPRREGFSASDSFVMSSLIFTAR